MWFINLFSPLWFVGSTRGCNYLLLPLLLANSPEGSFEPDIAKGYPFACQYGCRKVLNEDVLEWFSLFNGILSWGGSK